MNASISLTKPTYPYNMKFPSFWWLQLQCEYFWQHLPYFGVFQPYNACEHTTDNTIIPLSYKIIKQKGPNGSAGPKKLTLQRVNDNEEYHI
jgi:hypothetical protein